MMDTRNPLDNAALTSVIKTASESQQVAEQKAFDQAVYAQGLWWTAARNLELALCIDLDEVECGDLSVWDLETLKRKAGPKQSVGDSQAIGLYTADSLVDLIARMSSDESQEDNAMTLDNLISAAREIRQRRVK